MHTYYHQISNLYKDKGYKYISKKLFNFLLVKFCKLFEFLIFLPSSFIILSLVRLISIFKPIRFFPLNYKRIGNIYNLYWYQKIFLSSKSKREGNSLDLFFVEDQNDRLKTWKKITTNNIKLLPFGLIWKHYFNLNKFFWNSKKFEIKNFSFLSNYYSIKENYKDFTKISNFVDTNKILVENNNFLYFKNKEQENGKNYLKKNGTQEYKYVCFASRDNAYLKYYNSKVDWSYHSWRNCEINNFIPAIKYLSEEKNISCFRTGYKVEKKISYGNDKIINYADSKDQSPLLDIYLPNKCLFGIFAQSGISLPSEFSGRPIVYVNWPDMQFNAFQNNSLVITKKYFSKKKNRYLSFKEILELPYDDLNINFNQIRDKYGISLEENTPEEIKDVVIEQFKRIHNSWVETEEEKLLQKKFWLLYQKKFMKAPSFRIGSNFLKKYSALI